MKPASKETLDMLYINMGDTIKELFPMLIEAIGLIDQIDNYDQSSAIEEKQVADFRSILELQTCVLYSIIEICTNLRGDLRSTNNVEKRANLRYTVIVTSKLFKAAFSDKEKNNLWSRVVNTLNSGMAAEERKQYSSIEKAIREYNERYFVHDKDNRNLSVHYDYDPIVYYKYFCDLQEEKESVRICALLAILQPLNALLGTRIEVYKLLLPFLKTHVDTRLWEINNIFQDKSNVIYNKSGDTLIKFGNSIDRIMKSYQLPENNHEALSYLISEEEINRLKDARKYGNIGAILHFVYIDLCAAIRGYFSSDYYMEKQLHLIKINLLTYEGFKKIFRANPKVIENSYWKEHIYDVLNNSQDIELKKKLETTHFYLDEMDKDKNFLDDNLRNQYIHMNFDGDSQSVFIKVLLLRLNSNVELNNALKFIRILNNVIQLNGEALKLKSKLDTMETIDKFLSPINDIRDKIKSSKMSEEQKEQLFSTLDGVSNKISEIFE